MLDKMIGFIGAGNMGSAMIGGILDASLVTTSQIIASAHSPETFKTGLYRSFDCSRTADRKYRGAAR